MIAYPDVPHTWGKINKALEAEIFVKDIPIVGSNFKSWAAWWLELDEEQANALFVPNEEDVDRIIQRMGLDHPYPAFCLSGVTRQMALSVLKDVEKTEEIRLSQWARVWVKAQIDKRESALGTSA